MKIGATFGTHMNRKKRIFGFLRADVLVLFAAVFVGLELIAGFVSRPAAWIIGGALLAIALALLFKRTE